MKKIAVLMILLVLIGCKRTEYYIKTVVPPKTKTLNIVVIPENWDTWWATSFAYRALITELIDAGFTVIERSNLITILEELKLQHTGFVKEQGEKIKEKRKERRSYEINPLDRTSIKKFGEMLGADALLLVYVVPHFRDIHMATFRLVDVGTAKVLTSTTVVTPEGQDVDIIMKQVAIDIKEAFDKNKRVLRKKLFIKRGKTNIREKGDRILEEKRKNTK